jgi:hypothetical protein
VLSILKAFGVCVSGSNSDTYSSARGLGLEGTSTLSGLRFIQLLIITSLKALTVLNLVVLVSLSPYSKSGSHRMLVTSLPEGDSPGI